MLKWLSDWLMGKDLESNNIQVNPFPATEKAPEPVAVVSTAAPKAAKPKAEKKTATKKAADKKPAKAAKPKATKKKPQA